MTLRSLAVLCALLALSACRNDDRVGPSSAPDRGLADSVSHFLEQCSVDAECSSYLACECGRCTRACDVALDIDPFADSVSHFFPLPPFNPVCRPSAELVATGFCAVPPRVEAILILPCDGGACDALPTGESLVCDANDYCVQPSATDVPGDAGDADTAADAADLDALDTAEDPARDDVAADAVPGDAEDVATDVSDAADATDATTDAEGDTSDVATDADADVLDAAPDGALDTDVADADAGADADAEPVRCVGGSHDPPDYAELVALYGTCTELTGSLYIGPGAIDDAAFLSRVVTAESITFDTVNPISRSMEFPSLTRADSFVITDPMSGGAAQFSVSLPLLQTVGTLEANNVGFSFSAPQLVSADSILISAQLLTSIIDLSALTEATSVEVSGSYEALALDALVTVGELALISGRAETWSMASLVSVDSLNIRGNTSLTRVDAPLATVNASLALSDLPALTDPAGLPDVAPTLELVFLRNTGLSDLALLDSLIGTNVLRIVDNVLLTTIEPVGTQLVALTPGDGTVGLTAISGSPLLPECEARALLERLLPELTPTELDTATAGNDPDGICP